MPTTGQSRWKSVRDGLVPPTIKRSQFWRTSCQLAVLCPSSLPSFSDCSHQSQAQQTVIDCGKLLDVKAGVWREKMSVVLDHKLIKSILPSDRVDASVKAENRN